jgi:predicted transcriptional regulator
MATLTVRIPEELELVIKDFCSKEDRSKSWLIKKALQEKLEDWQYLYDGLKALEKHRKNPRVTSHKDLMKLLGLTDKDLE